MRPAIHQLAEAIQRVQQRSRSMRREDAVATGCDDVDRALGGGLARWAVHEWIADAPPLSLFIHLAQQAVTTEQVVLWISRSCWPHPVAMGRTLLDRSLFIDPPDQACRLWAIDLALRSPAVAMVVADGSGLAMAHSRRLQLAAEAGAASSDACRGRCTSEGFGSMAMLARPSGERGVPSVALTRWQVSPVATSHQPRWRIELIRAKNAQQVGDLVWEWDEGEGIEGLRD